jgi:hypothetical protein
MKKLIKFDRIAYDLNTGLENLHPFIIPLDNIHSIYGVYEDECWLCVKEKPDNHVRIKISMKELESLLNKCGVTVFSVEDLD